MTHVHGADCLVEDVVDMGDDGDGYIAYRVLVCSVTGESFRSSNL